MLHQLYKSNGVTISNHAGILQNGLLVEADAVAVVTDAIDVSDGEIVNAINLGANNIVGNDSVAFELNKTADTTLTLRSWK